MYSYTIYTEGLWSVLAIMSKTTEVDLVSPSFSLILIFFLIYFPILLFLELRVNHVTQERKNDVIPCVQHLLALRYTHSGLR